MCSKFNKTKVGNNTASNFSSSFRPRKLGGTFTCFFHCENNKTHSRYPKQEKYKVNDYFHLNQCSRRKIAFSIRQLQHPEVTMNPSLLSLCVFSSSCLEPKKEENCTPRRLVGHVSRDSRTLTFFRQDSL